VSAVFAFAFAALACLALELLGAMGGLVGVVYVREEGESAVKHYRSWKTKLQSVQACMGRQSV
jgi:hypothetical protein